MGRKIFIGILPLQIGIMDGTITENFLAMHEIDQGIELYFLYE